ncbi:hypothetical protein NPX13_g2303 [Xylaria arbuscula]|uniref:NmrA-like domain-containing protein n=1 Tax=Xylaria arbuscula TaxID=114810 RepID=A0A9W8NKN6_9PEZI|nr:hypothetical protein NPX13_g2303 [Xylaria arbuscula]
MPKLVTIVGATGNQGRAPERPRAGEQRRRGGRSLSRTTSPQLKAAFAGSYAVYGVTGIKENLANNDLATFVEVEATWGINIAEAAAETAGLQHFIWSTLPNASRISGGRHFLPNFAGKNRADEYIRANAELAAKTTFLFIAQYHSNYARPPVSMHKIPSANAYVHFASHPPDTPISWIGDVTRNLPAFIKPILEQPDKTRGSTVFAHTEVHTSEESLQIWANSKGVRAFHVPVSAELLHEMWGKSADVLAVMWRFWGEYREKSWTDPGHVVLTRDDLGVTGFTNLAETFKDYQF